MIPWFQAKKRIDCHPHPWYPWYQKYLYSYPMSKRNCPTFSSIFLDMMLVICYHRIERWRILHRIENLRSFLDIFLCTGYKSPNYYRLRSKINNKGRLFAWLIAIFTFSEKCTRFVPLYGHTSRSYQMSMVSALKVILR